MSIKIRADGILIVLVTSLILYLFLIDAEEKLSTKILYDKYILEGLFYDDYILESRLNSKIYQTKVDKEIYYLIKIGSPYQGKWRRI